MSVRDSYTPREPTEVIADPSVPAVVYKYRLRDGRPAAVAFVGRRQRPDLHRVYPSAGDRDAAVAAWLSAQRARLPGPGGPRR